MVGILDGFEDMISKGKLGFQVCVGRGTIPAQKANHDRGPLQKGSVDVSCPTTAVVPTTGWPWLALERKMLCAEI